jgi:hypothetical protein
VFLLIDGSFFLFILFNYYVFLGPDSSFLQWLLLDVYIFAKFDVLLGIKTKRELFRSMEITYDLA